MLAFRLGGGGKGCSGTPFFFFSFSRRMCVAVDRFIGGSGGRTTLSSDGYVHRMMIDFPAPLRCVVLSCVVWCSLLVLRFPTIPAPQSRTHTHCFERGDPGSERRNGELSKEVSPLLAAGDDRFPSQKTSCGGARISPDFWFCDVGCRFGRGGWGAL